jgi:predicted dehydrogenase
MTNEIGKAGWGVLGTARIAIQKVIPAIQLSKHGKVVAIASRDIGRARAAANALNIPKAYGSYEALLHDPNVDVVYNPLPNHLHVPWSIKVLAAEKHVLCEKPIALNVAEAEQLLEAAGAHPRAKVMEAFMYRWHPQWQRAKQIVCDGEIGQLGMIQSFFSYYNADPANIRNKAELGGGALMDIGCYAVSLSRFIFECEPKRVFGIAEYDGGFKTDRLTSGILDFGRGTSTFTCSTQLTPYQRVNIFGTEGRVEIEIPFNAPPDRRCKIWHQNRDELREIEFEPCDQYTIQADLFSDAVLNDRDVPVPIADAVANMRVIDYLFESARRGTWV